MSALRVDFNFSVPLIGPQSDQFFTFSTAEQADVLSRAVELAAHPYKQACAALESHIVSGKQEVFRATIKQPWRTEEWTFDPANPKAGLIIREIGPEEAYP